MTSSKGINEVFRDFYEKLYKSAGTPNKLSLQNFFMNTNLPNLSPEQVAFLDEPVTQGEVRNAIRSMKSGKSPELLVSLLNSIKNTLT